MKTSVGLMVQQVWSSRHGCDVQWGAGDVYQAVTWRRQQLQLWHGGEGPGLLKNEREEFPRTGLDEHQHLMRRAEVAREKGEKPRECNVKVMMTMTMIEKAF